MNMISPIIEQITQFLGKNRATFFLTDKNKVSLVKNPLFLPKSKRLFPIKPANIYEKF